MQVCVAYCTCCSPDRNGEDGARVPHSRRLEFFTQPPHLPKSCCDASRERPMDRRTPAPSSRDVALCMHAHWRQTKKQATNRTTLDWSPAAAVCPPPMEMPCINTCQPSIIRGTATSQSRILYQASRE